MALSCCWTFRKCLPSASSAWFLTGLRGNCSTTVSNIFTARWVSPSSSSSWARFSCRRATNSSPASLASFSPSAFAAAESSPGGIANSSAAATIAHRAGLMVFAPSLSLVNLGCQTTASGWY